MINIRFEEREKIGLQYALETLHGCSPFGQEKIRKLRYYYPDEREELETELKIGREEMMLALEASAEVESIYRPVCQGDGNAVLLLDKLEEKENQNEKLLNHMLLEQLLENLEKEERRLIDLRYFRDKTQMETARELGISQVQVSRMENRILQKMRGRI